MTTKIYGHAMRAYIERSAIPKPMQESVALYLIHGIRPGHFLSAVLSNDLAGAVKRGDDETLAAIPAYVRFLFEYAPAWSWGSPEKFQTWTGLEGLK